MCYWYPWHYPFSSTQLENGNCLGPSSGVATGCTRPVSSCWRCGAFESFPQKPSPLQIVAKLWNVPYPGLSVYYTILQNLKLFLGSPLQGELNQATSGWWVKYGFPLRLNTGTAGVMFDRSMVYFTALSMAT
eukprot:s2555_g15.t1